MRAKQDGKPVINVETAEATVQYLQLYNDSLGDYLLAETLKAINDGDEPEQTVSQLAETFLIWASGDTDRIMDVMYGEGMSELPEEYMDDYDEYMDRLIYQRNTAMAERAAEFITNGDNYFFTVGLAHCVGKEGIISRLEDMGFAVERVDTQEQLRQAA